MTVLTLGAVLQIGSAKGRQRLFTVLSLGSLAAEVYVIVVSHAFLCLSLTLVSRKIIILKFF